MSQSTVEMQDAMEAAIACNKGLDALVDLMMATSRGNAPSIDCLSELVLSLHRDMEGRLLELKRCIDRG